MKLGLFACAAVAGACAFAAAPATEKKIDDLLKRMTLEEKVGQLVQIGSGDFASGDVEKGPLDSRVANAVARGEAGLLISCCGIRKYNQLQKLAVEESRLGIPIMLGHDVIHGCRTVAPIPLGLSCAWDEELWRGLAETLAAEARTRGIDWTFAPMLDVSRDARWGRIAECAGQDPFLASRYAVAMVRGFQGDNPADGRHVAACLKHYVGYGACEGGRDYNTVELSDDTLRNVYLPPFEAGVRAGALSVMPAFHVMNGVPCSANPYLLRDTLRGRFGFEGLTVSDWGSIGELVPPRHGVFANLADAAAGALAAGMDVDMMSDAYRKHLAGKVKIGVVGAAALDEAVRHVLRVKFALGLFEHPYADEKLLGKLDLEKHAEQMRVAARKSVVLLKNEKRVLPLKKGARVVLMGELGDNPTEMLGTWQTWNVPGENATLLAGLKADGVDVVYAPCYTVTGAVDAAAVVAAATNADVVVATFGELCGPNVSMNGENTSRADVGLPGEQDKVVRALRAAGKPFVAVLFNGRPLAIPELAEACDALVEAWNPGSSGGWGVADVMTGVAEPTGRLTVDFPHKTGECPLYYNRLQTGRPWVEGNMWTTRYIDAPSPGKSLFPFGFGLAYVSFGYANEKVSVEGDKVVFTADVTNLGGRAGEEVVQVYVRDVVACVSRPRRELKGWRRLELAGGETKTARIEVPVSALGFWHAGRRVPGEGEFRAWIAPDSDRGRELSFTIGGNGK